MRVRISRGMLLVVGWALAAFLAACGAAQSAQGPTFGQLATSGQTVFANNCAVCHGAQGEGRTAPTLIGAGAGLAKFGNAQGMLSFITAAMPQNAPGSLPPDQYQQVLSYLLIQNKVVDANAPFEPDKLNALVIPPQ